MAPTHTVKISFNEELRRLPYDSSKGVQGLMELCSSAFNLKKASAFNLTYQDAEGDIIALSTNDELNALFKDTDTIKLSLSRKPFLKKGAVPTPDVPTESSSSSSTSKNEEVSENELKAKKDRKEKKAARKEKKAALLKQILNTKVVRIRWKDLNEVPAPTEGEKKICQRKVAKKQHKGCYVGANLSGKIKFNCGLGKKSLWLSHELSDSVMFSPVSAPRRYLRVCPDGTVNISNGGVGPRTRWIHVVDGDTGISTLTSNFNKLQLTGVSVGKKLKNKNRKEGGGKKKVIARCVDLAATTPKNIAAKQFWVEEVDATQLLVNVVKKLSNRRRVARKMRKEGRKNWKKNLKTQEELEKAKLKGKGKGKGKCGRRGHGHGKGKNEEGEVLPAVHPFRKAEYIC